MSRNTITSSLIETVITCVIFVVMSILSFYILPFVDFLFPIPAMILGKRRGYKYSALSLVVASLITCLIFSIQIGLMYLFIYTPISLVMSYLVSKDKKPFTVIIAGAIALLTSIVAVLYAMQLSTGIHITDEIISIFTEAYKIDPNIINNMKIDEAQLQLIKDSTKMLSETVAMLLPAILTIFSMLVSVFNYFILQILAQKFKIIINPLRDLSTFSLPKKFLYGAAFMIIMGYVLSMMNFLNMDIIVYNIGTVANFALIVQGLALVKYYLNKKRVNIFFKVIVLLAIIFIPIILTILSFVAVVDLIFDFRKLRIRK